MNTKKHVVILVGFFISSSYVEGADTQDPVKFDNKAISPHRQETTTKSNIKKKLADSDPVGISSSKRMKQDDPKIDILEIIENKAKKLMLYLKEQVSALNQFNSF